MKPFGANRDDMEMKREFLDPTRTLVDEVVAWLLGDERHSGRVVTVEGARSLAHLMVVVPTAQSGRSLRLALAREANRRGWGGLLPPRVVLPMQLVVPAQRKFRDASEIEIAVAFQQYVKVNRESLLALDLLFLKSEFDDLTARFALLDQLTDIWRILAGRGLLMGDVEDIAGTTLDAQLGEERRRWRQLGELERGFFGYLHEHGLAYPTESVRDARTAAEIVGDEIAEIVLPALADPLRVFDEVMQQQVDRGKSVTVLLHAAPEAADRFSPWGRPLTAAWTGANRPVLSALTDGNIVTSSDGAALAEIVAGDFPAADGDGALPSLALCDDDLFGDLAGAFLKRGYMVHNPERHALANSSLGRMIDSLMALYAGDELRWRDFAALFRTDDVMTALGLDVRARARVLEGLDLVQNACLPSVIPSGFAFPSLGGEDDGADDRERRNRALMREFADCARRLAAVMDERRRGVPLAEFLRAMLQWIFSARRISAGASEKEFLAALESARDFLNLFDCELLRTLAPAADEFAALARRELRGALYSLEPDTRDAIRTEGWLELAWSAAECLALAGFHEGKVPDSVVGHAFLPDRLREALGLCSNADRLARDTWLLNELFASHGGGKIRIYVARTNARGDICRPSRLLYLCADAELPQRVERLFGNTPLASRDRSRRVEWAMRLPDELPPTDHFSPSALDTYIKCPFDYLLKYGLGMRPYAEKEELGADDFGTLTHAALELYARIQIGQGDSQLTDENAIRRLFHEEIMPVIRARYGKLTLNLELQFEAIEGRLDNFAKVQADWAQKGWRIRAAELEIGDESSDDPAMKYVDSGLGFRVHGFVDRIDENINDSADKRFCVIDYKTWDEASLVGHVVTSSRKKAEIEFAQCMGFPTLTNKGGKPNGRVLSVQLPVYAKCIASVRSEFRNADFMLQYLVLGESEQETMFVKLEDDVVACAIATAARAVKMIGANIFWPPGPGEEWKWDFAALFVSDPKLDLADTEWERRQQAKLKGMEAGND